MKCTILNEFILYDNSQLPSRPSLKHNHTYATTDPTDSRTFLESSRTLVVPDTCTYPWHISNMLSNAIRLYKLFRLLVLLTYLFSSILVRVVIRSFQYYRKTIETTKNRPDLKQKRTAARTAAYRDSSFFLDGCCDNCDL